MTISQRVSNFSRLATIAMVVAACPAVQAYKHYPGIRRYFPEFFASRQ